MSKNQQTNYVVMFIIAIITAVFAYTLMQPEDPADKMADAMEDMADSVSDAAKELDPNRTTGEKIGDEIEELGEQMQDAAN